MPPSGNTRPRRRPLDLGELREESLIADLIATHDVEPDLIEICLAPVLSHWSVAEGPRLIGIDEWGAVIAIEVWAIAPDRLWATTPGGLMRLSRRSLIPLERT
ncbi:hypothetical protein [Microvirga makkahensis]|uniref:Uncharacterized protein n=1 Tax=Microvirga makkahensis TaxID=1128670 RepID=A0A7X3MP63_9HYPH|nr:hypothetical protein [Microvirga makkahensis]MXQ10450.1 hypothetical protein [Microvirga makkahensis]